MKLRLVEVLGKNEEGMIFSEQEKEYQVLDEIGRGSTCITYRGIDHNGNNIAIKSYTENDGEILFDKNRTYTRLRNIVPHQSLRTLGVFYDRESKQFYMIQDTVPGTIYSLENCPSASILEELECLESMLKVLEKFHEQSYVLLDLKPDNLYKVKGKNELMLFDLDAAAHFPLPDEGQVYTNQKYAPAELWTTGPDLMTDVYMLLSIFIERLFRILPKFEKFNRKKTAVDKIARIRGGFFENAENTEGKFCIMLYDFLAKELNQFVQERSSSIDHVLLEVAELKNHLREKKLRESTGRSFSPLIEQKEMIQTHRIYSILEDYPVYSYNAEDKELNIVIYGMNDIRTYILESVISCVQMLDYKLNIYLFMTDAEKFWKQEVVNKPDLRSTVNLWYEGKRVSKYSNRDIVDYELANIYLYCTDDCDRVSRFIQEKKLRYLFLIHSNYARNHQMIEKLEQMNAEKLFFAYLSEEEYDIEKMDCRHIPSGALGLQEDDFYLSYLYRKALQINNSYYQGIMNTKARKQMEKEFRESPYSIRASERTAVHMIYKLKSIGIDPDSDSAVTEFREKVLSGTEEARELFEKLTYLEHFSWTAYSIMQGYRHATLAELRAYAYTNGNDWKNYENAPYIQHACIAATRLGGKISEQDWETQDISMFDPLDQMSICLHQICRKLAMDRKNEIEEMLEILSDHTEEYNRLKEITEACYQFKWSYGKQWNPIMDQYMKKKILDYSLTVEQEKAVTKLLWLVKPLLEAGKKRDFKGSDEDMVRIVPLLLEMF